MAKSEKRKIGDVGEGLTAKFLEERGYKIVERNYLKKWGEIDIVAQNKEGLHFIEVKSISNPNFRHLSKDFRDRQSKCKYRIF